MTEAEIVGYVVLGLGTVLGLYVTLSKLLSKPISDLKDSLNQNAIQSAKLAIQIENLTKTYNHHEEEFAKQIAHNSEAHKRLWEHNEQQDERLDNHEIRLTKLEGNKNEH